MRKIFALTLSAYAAVQSVSARGQDSSNAFTPTSTAITSKLLSLEDCEATSLNGLESSRYPRNDDVIADSALSPHIFMRAVCLFHRDSSDLKAQQKTIDYLQKAQKVGLLASQRNTAALFEGIAHCRAAEKLYKGGDFSTEDKRTRQVNQQLFCMHRSMAKENFADINWSNFKLSYDDPKEGSLDAHITTMAECGKTWLTSSLDSTCGEITALSQSRVEEIAAEAADKVLNQYLGDPNQTVEEASLPPFKAITERKKKMVQATLERSSVNFSILKADNKELNSGYTNLLALYGSETPEGILKPGNDLFPGRVGLLYEDYINGVARAQTLIQLIELWKKGLCSENGADRCFLLSQQVLQLKSQAEYFFGKNNEGGLVKNLDILSSRLNTLAENRVEPNRKVTRSMCALYYCEVRRRRPDDLKKTCSIALGTSGSFLYSMNPLCDNPKDPAASGIIRATQADGSTVTKPIAALCTEAGFNENYIKQASLSEADVNTCISSNLDKETLGKLGL